MPRVRLTRLAAACAVLAALLVGAIAANAALVRVNGIVLHADGGFQPRSLPRKQFVPIEFQGFFDIASSTSLKPPVLEEAVIDFDRDGRLSAGGLPVCPPERLANASPEDARKLCSGAIVGRGRIEAVIELPDGPAPASSPLTLFNGPQQNGNPTVVFHSRIGPGNQTIAMVVPVERRSGEFRYRATLVFPPIDEGRGAITHVQVEVGRRFTVDGKKRSYVSARCRDGILRTHGRFRFADGTIIDGSVEKACAPR
jgi:hypothetical protein